MELVHEETNFVHINWGWGGFDNGYFKGDLIATHHGESYDDYYLQLSSEYYFRINKFYVVK